MKDIIRQFDIDGEAVSIEKYGSGHINRTFLVTTDRNKRYILQRINRSVFKDIPGLMHNIVSVTDYISKNSAPPAKCLTLIRTIDENFYYTDENGECFRVYDYIEDGICLNRPESPADFYESARAFGEFQRILNGFPAETLTETIPHFHDTPGRFEQFHRAISRDPLGRAGGVNEEIGFFLSMEKDGGILMDKLKEGILPLRVTHNDTKLNNVILDSKTRKALCVIDLDTVMPGLAACDFGDAIRFGASTAEEDEKDTDKVHLDLELYKIFTRGFLESCGELLSDEEILSLPIGAKLMTLENGIRFLTDYLEGDTYYSIDYPDHNLIRSRTQLKLLKETKEKWDAIMDILHRCSSAVRDRR